MNRSRALLPVLALTTAGGLVLGLAACTSVPSTSTVPDATVSGLITADSIWDSTVVHEIAIDVDDATLEAAIQTYLDTQEKVWISATVTIDGTVFENVGLKLKGNSTLRAISADDDPATMPWLIRLDKYVDDQSLDGDTEFVVRANSSETALNEAVALELLGLAGLATEEAVASRFTVNGGTTELRLVIENPNDDWDAENFATDGALYKAEAGGSYDYRGDDAAEYVDVFDQESGDDDIAPLAAFLQFINESDDATFAAELADHLDVEAFATYLAYQELVNNFDDIDGPGNNSYLRYDAESSLMTVVNWDLNLAFGVSNVDGGGPGGGQGVGQPGGAGGLPAGAPGADAGVRPDGAGGAPMGGGQAGAGGPSSGNILAERFREVPQFAAMIEAATVSLQADLYDSGAAQQILDAWVATLNAQAADLVDAATIEQEAAAVAEQF